MFSLGRCADSEIHDVPLWRSFGPLRDRRMASEGLWAAAVLRGAYTDLDSAGRSQDCARGGPGGSPEASKMRSKAPL